MKTTNSLPNTALKIYYEIKAKPQTYTQLKNTLQLPNATLSRCLQSLKLENLIEKTILKDQPNYKIIENNVLEFIDTVLIKKNPSKQDELKFRNIFLTLSLRAFAGFDKHSRLNICLYRLREQTKLHPKSLLPFLETNPKIKI